jgi:hypothetical protein
MILHGKDLIVMVNGTAIAMSKSCDINVDADIIPTASPSDGQWEDGITGRKSWKITTNHLVSSVASMAAMVGTIVTLRVKISGNNTLTEQLQGYAICRTMKATATVGNLAQGSFVWVGKGSLANPTS